MMHLITVRVTGAGDTVLPTTTKGRCEICGEEVYVASSSRKVLREYDMGIICTACISRFGPKAIIKATTFKEDSYAIRL